MSRIIIRGAGVSGHTAASFVRKSLDNNHEVVVVSPLADYNWIPSNTWVGVGLIKPQTVAFPLAPVYRRNGIEFHQAKAESIHPEGNSENTQPYVVAESTVSGSEGALTEIPNGFMRTSLPYQLWRFVWINLRMMAVIRAGHQGQH